MYELPKILLSGLALLCTTGGYYIYTCSNPGTDGLIFGTFLGVIGLISGVSINALRGLISRQIQTEDDSK